MLAPRVTTAQTQDESYARTTAQTMWQQAHEGPEPKEAWEAFVEDETGDIYYHNEATNETSWVPPGHWSAAEAEAAIARAKAADAAWAEASMAEAEPESEPES